MKTFSSCCPFNKEIRSDVILAIKKGVTDRFRRLVIRAGGEESDIKNRWVIHVQCSPEHTCTVFTRTYMYSVHQNIHVQCSPEHTCTVFTRTYLYSFHQNIHVQCSPEHTCTLFTRIKWKSQNYMLLYFSTIVLSKARPSFYIVKSIRNLKKIVIK